MGEAKRRKGLDPYWGKPKDNIHHLPQSMSLETEDQAERDRQWFLKNPAATEYTRPASESELAALAKKGVNNVLAVKVKRVVDGVQSFQIRTFITQES